MHQEAVNATAEEIVTAQRWKDDITVIGFLEHESTAA
jgi:hypothetical protein